MYNKSEIISLIIPYAKMLLYEYNLLPSVTISQVILETDWLRHRTGNNVFNITWTAEFECECKTDSECEFDYQEILTYELINGMNTPKIALLKKYLNYNESFRDYARLITTSKRYLPVVNASTYKDACNELYICGYYRNPKYTSKLISIIEDNKLYEYDHTDYTSDKATSKDS